MTPLRPLLLALALIGCGETDAPQKCEDLIGAVCLNIEEKCFTPMSAEECQSEFDSVFDCDEAIATGETYEQCMDEIEAEEECLADEDQELPASCDGVILYAE